MAGSIKGITLEIGGSTTKLTQALKEPQKESMALQSKLKEINKALKFDSSNVDLLNQKQRVLTQTINSTESELKLLKEAQKQYIDSGKDLDGEEYIALESKIIKTQQALENLQKQQNNFTGELQVLGSKVGEFGQKTEELGKKFLPVTAGVTAIGTAATAAWSELDEAYDGIAAGTGATGEALEELQQNFRNVYGDFPASSAEVGTCIADINTRFGLTGEALEKASKQFLEYAKVNNADVSGSIEAVAKAMADAGIPTEELGNTLDKLTVASQASGLSVDAISQALSKNGVNMRELGYSTDETIALLTTFEKNGVDTSTVLTGLKAAVKTCAKEGKDAKWEMANLFEAIKDGSATAADAQELFGSKAGTALYNYAREGKLDITSMMDVISGSAGGLERTFNDMLDPADKFQVAMNNLKLAGSDLGTQIQETLAPMIEMLVDLCKRISQWFSSLSDGQKDFVVKAGLVAAAIGPVLIAIGKMGQGFSTLITYFGNMSTIGGKAIAALNNLTGAASIGAGPLLALVAATAAVIGAFVSLWNNNEDFRNRMMEIWNEIVSKVQEFCNGIVERFNSLEINFQEIIDFIKTLWEGFCNFLAPIFEGVWAQISTVISTALDLIMNIVDAFIALFKGDWEGFWQAIDQGIQTIWSGIGTTIDNAIQIITDCISVFLSWFGIEWDSSNTKISEIWHKIWDSIKTFLQSTVDAIKGVIDAFISLFHGDWEGFSEKIKKVWEDVWSGIQSFFSGIVDKIKETASNAWNSIKQTASNIWDGIRSAIETPMENAKNFVSDIIDKIKGFFDFEISWPNIPLPHFAINPPGWDIGDLLHGEIPSLGIDWYAKAMNDGFIFNRPTLFGLNQDGQAMGAGEAGPEALIGVHSLRSLINDAVDKAAQRKLEQIRQTMNDGDPSQPEIDYEKMASAIVSGLSGVLIQNNVNIGLKTVVKELLPLIDAGLEQRKKRR